VISRASRAGPFSGGMGHYALARDPPYALEEWCDASDPIEKQSIVPPKQIIK
jgi:hypothetical protein